MSANDLHSVLSRSRPRQMEEHAAAEKCLVATTADDVTDEVFVTLPEGVNPGHRESVLWRLEFEWNGTDAVPRWPTRGDKGIVLRINTGELWLIY